MDFENQKTITLIGHDGKPLPVSTNTLTIDLETTSFGDIKEAIKNLYTGTTRLTDNDIGFFYERKPVLEYLPLNMESQYGFTNDTSLAELFDNGPSFQLEVAINVDGFFRNYEPVFTGGLLRSEGNGFISNLLNAQYSNLFETNTEGGEILSLVDPDKILEKDIVEESKNTLKNEMITPRIQFVDSLTKNRIKILSDINEGPFVLVEIEDLESSKTKKGYLPKANFDNISNFVFSFVPKYSHSLETLTISDAKIKKTLSFKNDIAFLDKQTLLENGVLTLKDIQNLEKNSNGNHSLSNDVILNSQQSVENNPSQINSNVMDDLRIIFNPRPAFIESFLIFLGVIFKTLYLIFKHSVLASFVLFQLANFIPLYYALSLVVLNLMFTLLTDVEIKQIWEEFFKSFKMFEKDYNDLLGIVLDYKHIPLHFLIQFDKNTFVREYFSDALRNSQDFILLDSLYDIVHDDQLAKTINLDVVKTFIQNSQLPKRIITYPYKTLSEESYLMLAEPRLEETELDNFVDVILKVLKKNFSTSCLKNNNLFTETNSKTLNDCLLREGKNMLKGKYKVYEEFQKPLFDLIVEDMNFWKINNIHLKRNNVVRWNVDFEEGDDIRKGESVKTEVTRIDTDLYDMLEIVLQSIRHPQKFLPLRSNLILKDSFFQYNYNEENYMVLLNNGQEKVFYKNGAIQRVERIDYSDNSNRSMTIKLIFGFIMQPIVIPVKSAILLCSWCYRVFSFLVSFFNIGPQRWISILIENVIDGDILYNFLPVENQSILGTEPLQHMLLYWCVLIPSYQEKVHVIINERDNFYKKLENYRIEKEAVEQAIREKKQQQEEEQVEDILDAEIAY
ncbi:hypothetical protein QEN19_000896 [Hanseniaspora menglaensis]